ncbi:hypothetical protein [Photobacterium halotolerans]|uniref:hypothetical protein n=1 Tax=Photobacterium halotolerans TaxID=265726 RepID=UPI00041311AB|nr:hypothetical protein [Photobacterium halotolerans]
MRASYSLLAQTVTRNAFVSLVLPGPVVGAPCADNLKIRPEFFPGEVDIINGHSQAAISASCGNPNREYDF